MDMAECELKYFSFALRKLTESGMANFELLTKLAGQYIVYSDDIVQVIEDHVRKSRVDVQLSVLYVIDSIVKNINGIYLHLFSRCIVNIFGCAFRQADPQMRMQMLRLRNTWTGVFPVQILYALDVEIHLLNGIWPPTEPLPRFPNIRTRRPSYIRKNFKSQSLVNYQEKISNLQSENAMLQRLLSEIAWMRQEQAGQPGSVARNLAAQNQSYTSIPQVSHEKRSIETHADGPTKKIKLNGQLMVRTTGSSHALDSSHSTKYQRNKRTNLQPHSQTGINNGMGRAVVPISMTTSSAGSRSDSPPSSSTDLDIKRLHARLIEVGIIPRPADSADKTQPSKVEHKSEVKTVAVSFDDPKSLSATPDFKTLYDQGKQCGSCGQRFLVSEPESYKDHLDWHFRQNRSAKIPKSRDWYMPLEDFVQYPSADIKKPCWFELQDQQCKETAELAAASDKELQPSVPSGSDSDAKCSLCHDKFEEFYSDEEEEWLLRPAVTHEGRNYHPLCWRDHKMALEES